tara:strand:+ start:824 stop:1210 length:387 start_codon:yes stop_codon:yes gene_type:complete
MAKAKIRKKRTARRIDATKSNTANSGHHSSAYPKAEYIDTRGTFDKSMSRKAENVTGVATSGRTIAKYGDANFPEIAYLSSDNNFRGGTWDRAGRVFTPGKQSYTATRTGSGRRGSPYVYALEAIREV